MVVIRNGRFISRKKTSSDEVHQMRSNGSYGYELKYNKNELYTINEILFENKLDNII